MNTQAEISETDPFPGSPPISASQLKGMMNGSWALGKETHSGATSYTKSTLPNEVAALLLDAWQQAFLSGKAQERAEALAHYYKQELDFMHRIMQMSQNAPVVTEDQRKRYDRIQMQCADFGGAMPGRCLFKERSWSPGCKPQRCAMCPDALLDAIEGRRG